MFSSASSASFAENATGAVYTAVANPIASGASVSYSISGGADSAKFSISSNGVVSLVSSLNHESPTDAGSNNVYNLVITATEAGNTNLTTHSVAVTVTDVGDVAPSFTSGNSVSVTENTTGAVYTAVVSSDVTGAVVSYSISSGADSAKFSINSSSGWLAGRAAPTLRPQPARPAAMFTTSSLPPPRPITPTPSRKPWRSRSPMWAMWPPRSPAVAAQLMPKTPLERSIPQWPVPMWQAQHQLQHQRYRCRPVQHQQQQRGGGLCQQPEL